MIRIEVETTTTYEVDESFVWPDGQDAPTAAKAKSELTSEMNGCSVGEWLCWELIDEQWTVLKVRAKAITAIEVEVPNPAYSGEAVLFGDPPAKTIIDRVKL